MEQQPLSGRVEVNSQSLQSSSSSLQQDCIYSKSYVRPRELLNGSSSQNASRLGVQHMEEDSNNIRIRRLCSKNTNK